MKVEGFSASVAQMGVEVRYIGDEMIFVVLAHRPAFDYPAKCQILLEFRRYWVYVGFFTDGRSSCSSTATSLF